jgi:hypothetical protein
MAEKILVLALGLLGGVAGALGTNWLVKGTAEGGGGSALARGDADLALRLERLEARLGPEAGPLLAGRVAEPAAGTPEALPSAALSPGAEAALVERLTPQVEAIAARKVEALQKEREKAQEQQDAGRPAVTLAEAAARIGLSANEEDALRQIYRDYEERMLKIVAGEDGDLAELQRDLETAKADEAARPKLMQKYLPRVLPKLGEVMALEFEKQARIEEALGEKAQRLEEFDIEESHPFGIGGSMRVEASAQR